MLVTFKTLGMETITIQHDDIFLKENLKEERKVYFKYRPELTWLLGEQTFKELLATITKMGRIEWSKTF